MKVFYFIGRLKQKVKPIAFSVGIKIKAEIKRNIMCFAFLF